MAERRDGCRIEKGGQEPALGRLIHHVPVCTPRIPKQAAVIVPPVDAAEEQGEEQPQGQADAEAK